MIFQKKSYSSFHQVYMMWMRSLSAYDWESNTSKTIGAGCEFGLFLEDPDNCKARQQEVGKDLVYVT